MSDANRVELPAGVTRSVGRHAYFDLSDGDGPPWYIHDWPTNGLIPAYRFSTDGPVRFSGQGLMTTDAGIAYEPCPASDDVSGYGLHSACWVGAGTGVFTTPDAPGVRIDRDGDAEVWQWTDATGSYPIDSLADVARRVLALREQK